MSVSYSLLKINNPGGFLLKQAIMSTCYFFGSVAYKILTSLNLLIVQSLKLNSLIYSKF